jgi:methyl-accepting chemotaxis protein
MASVSKEIARDIASVGTSATAMIAASNEGKASAQSLSKVAEEVQALVTQFRI